MWINEARIQDARPSSVVNCHLLALSEPTWSDSISAYLVCPILSSQSPK